MQAHGVYITQWRDRTDGRWREDMEQQKDTNLQSAREFKVRLIRAGYTARIVSRTDIVVE